MRWAAVLQLGVFLGCLGLGGSIQGAKKQQKIGPRELGLLPTPTGDLLGFENPGDVPRIPEQGELVVQKVRPADCRVVLGFVHSPVDGRIDSWGYNGVVQEYNDSQGYAAGHWQNVTYEFLQDPGVHVTLADDAGFNYLYLRGGFAGAVYRDVDACEGPGHGTRILAVDSWTGPAGPRHYLVSRHALPEVVKARRISFFRKKNLLADGEFFRIGSAAVPARYTGGIEYHIGSPVTEVAALGPDFVQLPANDPQERHPSSFQRRFFRPADRHAWLLRQTKAESPHPSPLPKGEGTAIKLPKGEGTAIKLPKGEGTAIKLPKGEATDLRQLAETGIDLAPSQQIHLITTELPAGTAVGAVRLDLCLDGAAEGDLVHLTVQDPLIGNQELLRIDVRAAEGGRVRCLLDFPDQLMAPQGRFWITLASQRAARVSPESRITLLTVPADAAREEYVAYRKFLLKGYFYVLSEQRPWNRGAMSVAWLRGYDGREWEVQRVRPQLLDMYRTLEDLRSLAPDDPIVEQYHAWLNPQRKAASKPALPLEVPPGVPRWAVLLDRAAAAVVEIPKWWLTHRAAPNGELGGTLNDDTDMLQWWIPSALLDSESFAPLARDEFRRMYDLVIGQNLREGINRRTTDALHAYEEGLNHTCLMPLLFYGDPQYLEQLMVAARSVEKWLVRSDRGLRFRSDDFGWETAQHPPRELPEKVSDNSALMLHPHVMLAWYNHDPHAIRVICQYLDDQGDRIPYAFGAGWTLNFAAYWFTGNPKYLHLVPDGRDARGNPWARFHPEFVTHAVEARQQPWWGSYCRTVGRQILAGDWAWAASQDHRVLEQTLDSALWGPRGTHTAGAERFRYMWTEAEPFTDRVFLPVETPAQAMLGGYSVRNRLWPAYAVSYEGLSGGFAGLVLDQGRDRLTLAMINLRGTPRSGAVRLWQLDHGRYELSIGPDADDDGRPDSIDQRSTLVLKRMDRIAVTLPSRKLMIYQLRQLEKLDDVYARADLAIGPADVAGRDGGLEVTVHNLGRSAAAAVAVAMTDASGKVLAQQTIPRLEPAHDLVPSRAVVRFPAAAGAARVTIDPEGRIPELTRENNVTATP